MKAELVNLVTKSGTEMVVLLSTDLDRLTPEERVQAVEVTVWLVDEGWTVMTRADSPLAGPVQRGAEAMSGTYRALEKHASMRVTTTQHPLPLRVR
jgi:hypothetical protein